MDCLAIRMSLRPWKTNQVKACQHQSKKTDHKINSPPRELNRFMNSFLQHVQGMCKQKIIEIGLILRANFHFKYIHILYSAFGERQHLPEMTYFPTTLPSISKVATGECLNRKP